MVLIRVGAPLDVDAMGWASGRDQLEHWRSVASDPNSLLLVAKENTVICGKAVLNFSSRPAAAWLWLMSVDPNHRNRGIGTALLLFAENEALARGYHVVELAVDEVNPRARTLYERLGYTAQRPHVDHVSYVADDGTRISRDVPGTLLRRTMPDNAQVPVPLRGLNLRGGQRVL